MFNQVTVMFIAVLLSAAVYAHDVRTNIYFWHSMASENAATLAKLTKQFNQRQDKYQVILLYKGDYNTSFASLVAAYRAHQQPAIVQVLEVGTATMMSAQSVYYPVSELMRHFGYPITVKQFIPAIGYYYANQKDELQAMPFNVSSPVLYYNKAAFKKAGLSDPPTTWPALAKDAERLLKAGYHCGYTTAWPAWIQLEVFSAWHNIPYANQHNGLAGMASQVLYNNPTIQNQLSHLAQWQSNHIFQYGGRGDNAQSLFTSGHCVMFTQSSGSRGSLIKAVDFPVGVSTLPYWPSVKGAPQNSSIGGAALWVMRGHSNAVYEGVAQFFHFLMQAKTQLIWQQHTGYLPLTLAAYHYAKQQGYYQNNPGSDVAVKELLNKPTTVYSRGIRLGNFIQIRDINDSAMEAVFSGQMNVQQALAQAQTEANKALARFKEMNS